MNTLIKIHALAAIFALLLVSYGTKTFAQGNLQFNQVINRSVDNSTYYTVPAGKVFKLEAASSSGVGYLYAGAIQIYINGLVYIGSFSTSSSIVGNWPFPIWLRAGDSVQGNGIIVGISGIEFNIIP